MGLCAAFLCHIFQQRQQQQQQLQQQRCEPLHVTSLSRTHSLLLRLCHVTVTVAMVYVAACTKSLYTGAFWEREERAFYVIMSRTVASCVTGYVLFVSVTGIAKSTQRVLSGMHHCTLTHTVAVFVFLCQSVLALMLFLFIPLLFFCLFFSAPFWTPLSRLSYCLYLTHNLIIMTVAFESDQLNDYALLNVGNNFVLNMVRCWPLALLLYLCVERPAQNIVGVLFFKRSATVEITPAKATATATKPTKLSPSKKQQ